ncbi:MAG: hypothetical protein WBG18_12335 [Xanthobacteraceae bacterium]
MRIITISRICILNQFVKECGALLAAFWLSDWKLSVAVNRLIKSRPVEAPSGIGFSAVAGNLFVADDAIGIVERRKAVLDAEHQLFERFVLCVPERKDVAVQVDDLDTDGKFVEIAKRFVSDIQEGLTRVRALPDRAGIKVPEIVEVTVFRQDKVSADFFLSIAEDFQRAFQTARRVVNDDVLDGNQFVRKVGAGMINAFQFLAPVLQQRHRQRRAGTALFAFAKNVFQQYRSLCGRRLGENFLLQHWSGAVMCPACLCGGEAAGHNALRGSGPNR